MENKIRTFKHINTGIENYYVFCQSEIPPSSLWIECDESELNRFMISEMWLSKSWVEEGVQYFAFI